MQISQDSSSRHLRKFRQTDLGIAPMIVLDLRGSASHCPASYVLCDFPPGSLCSIRKVKAVLMDPGWAQRAVFPRSAQFARKGAPGPQIKVLGVLSEQASSGSLRE